LITLRVEKTYLLRLVVLFNLHKEESSFVKRKTLKGCFLFQTFSVEMRFFVTCFQVWVFRWSKTSKNSQVLTSDVNPKNPWGILQSEDFFMKSILFSWTENEIIVFQQRMYIFRRLTCATINLSGSW